jgi:hypothetical protein
MSSVREPCSSRHRFQRITPEGSELFDVPTSTREARHTPHAAARWASAVGRLVNAQRDPVTVAQWGEHASLSIASIRNWCDMAGITPRRSLTFGRLLRAVTLSNAAGCMPEDLLDVRDGRTLRNMRAAAGFAEPLKIPREPGVFVEQQTLVTGRETRDEVLIQLKRIYGGRLITPGSRSVDGGV